MRKGSKRPIYWNEYKVIPNKISNAKEHITERFDASIQGINRFFVFAYIGGNGNNIITEDSYQRDLTLFRMGFFRAAHGWEATFLATF